MDIRGKIALVTGANRGLGRAFSEALLEAGATKVYAGARDPSAVIDPRVTPIHVDVTSSRDIAAAAATCTDIEILINNAGAMLATPVLAENSEDVLRREMEVNVFGMLAMSRAFAPVLARNGGGVLVNMLSVVSWYVYPFNSTYCATKHAALAVRWARRCPAARKPPHGRWPRKQSKAFALASSMSWLTTVRRACGKRRGKT